MSGDEVLLDTNAIIALNRNEPGLLNALGRFERLTSTVVTLGKLYFGAANSVRSEENRRRIRDLEARVRFLAPDSATAAVYGSVLKRLRDRGRPIPTNDIWIAALALQHDLPLLTHDSHFREIDALSVLSW